MPPPCSLSMFTNAAGLFACGTAFDKGMRAIIINLVSGRKELPVQSCSWSCGAAWTSAQLLLPVLLGTSSAIRQAHRPIPSPLRLRLFRWWACPSALACSAVCGPLPPPRMPTRWAPGSSSPSSRCGQRPFVLGAQRLRGVPAGALVCTLFACHAGPAWSQVGQCTLLTTNCLLIRAGHHRHCHGKYAGRMLQRALSH